jgi:uncharacterized membrane protein
MTSDNAAGKPPAGRTLRVALVASLALNVLIIGAVAGTLLWPHHHHWKGQAYKGLAGFARTLPSEREEAIRQDIERNRAALAPLRKAERETRDAARKLLLEDPFDVEKFKAALALAAEADAKEKSTKFSLFADMAATLTPEERRELHAWFEKRHARYRHYRDKD